MKKKYNNFEEIKKDADNNIKVHWGRDVFFVKKHLKHYCLATLVPNGKYVVYSPIENYSIVDFYSYTSDVNIVINEQAKFFASEIAGKISDKEELEEYLKIRLKEFLRIINE